MLAKIIPFLLVLYATASGAASPSVVISFNKDVCEFQLSDGADSSSISFRFTEASVVKDKIMVRGLTILRDSVLTIGGLSTNIKALSVEDVSEREGFYDVTLAKRFLSRRQLRRGGADVINLFAPIEIGKEEFIRGSLLSIAGHVTIRGEVNGDVVSLFGDVNLKDEGTCYRDVYAIGGSIKVNSQAHIYGAVQSTEKWKRSDIIKRRRIHYGNKPIEYGPRISYNRVDGLLLGAQIAFYPQENFVPKFFFSFDYGFTSQRGKYELGFEQRLFDYNQLVFGGSVYRQSRTTDDWRADKNENTLYAIVNSEDYRDYWDGEGGKLYLEQNYKSVHKLRLQLSFEQLDSLPAHPRLWSLLGGDKGFRSNFSSLPEPLRAAGQSAFSKSEGMLELSYTYNSTFDLYQRQPYGWYAQVLYQHSSKELDSDFRYDRYRLELRRYQPLTPLLGLNIRALYGAATGAPPIHRLFYLGGIRTLRGYKIKEFYGTHAALLNTEYLIAPPRWVVAFAVLFDLGVTGDDSDFLSHDRWKGDYGFGVWLGETARVELTRPFNGSSDKMRLSILAQHAF